MASEQKSTNLPSKTTTSASLPINKLKASSLRRRLLLTILPTVLIPLVVASAIGSVITERKAKAEFLNALETDTVLSTKTVTTFLRDSFKTIDLIVANPSIPEAMKAGAIKAEEENLTTQSISELNKKFADEKRLINDKSLANYLQKAVRYSPIAEVLFTDVNGFNVAHSSKTLDFVQSDESWWQEALTGRREVQGFSFDELAETNVMQLAEVVRDFRTGDFLGVIRAKVAVDVLQSDIENLYGNVNQDFRFQIIDSASNFIVSNIEKHESNQEARREDELAAEGIEGVDILGGQSILEVGKILVEVAQNEISLAEANKTIQETAEFSEVRLDVRQDQIFSETIIVALLKYQNRFYTISTIPKTNLVSIGEIDYEIIISARRSLQTVFIITAVALGLVSLGIIFLLAQQITKPLVNLSATTQKVAEGDLNVEADIKGTLETKTLAYNFNNLVKQTKKSLEEQKALAEEQRQGKEQLETAIYTLLDEVSDATEGDLTVRANLDSMELSTVADLFNAIIDNLQDIAIEAKQSSSQVGDSLKQNESAIRLLAQQAVAEAQETRSTLMSVEQMSLSIQAVAQNANQAEQIVDDTYNTVLTSTQNMDSTVDSILTLRTTVGETAKKIKRLGESSQKISQAVSFIEEIALKTNILAINATVEAGRAGEYGEGFTIVAEQVATLAEQSATATKEIAGIVAAIQAETTEVNQAMESGTTQVVETTRLVESTKESLGLVLEKSQQINELMVSISESTVSQADTSQSVTNLMQKIAQLSETTSKSSQEVAQSIVETAQVAAKLQSTVSQFKVAE